MVQPGLARDNEAAAMKRQNIHPPGLPQRIVNGRLLYSHVVAVESARTIYVSGQLARDAQGNLVGKGDMAKQLRQVGENIKTALAAADARLDDIVKITTFTTDIDEFFKHVDIRAEYFGKALPASTAVEVRRLSHPDFLVEIEVVAVTGA